MYTSVINDLLRLCLFFVHGPARKGSLRRVHFVRQATSRCFQSASKLCTLSPKQLAVPLTHLQPQHAVDRYSQPKSARVD